MEASAALHHSQVACRSVSHCCGFDCRAQILAKKVSARAFKVVPGKQGETAGDIGIEGTAIEAPTEVSLLGMVFLRFQQG